MGQAVLLVCTVGGSPEAVAAAIKGCQPEKIIFAASPASEASVQDVLSMLARDDVPYRPAQYDVVQVSDPQDLSTCVEELRQRGREVSQWLSKGQGFEVVADITGGTKCMSAALALVARQWPCRLSYVGGEVRNKGGLGSVISGKEKYLDFRNPWDTLGYQVLEDSILLFNKGDYQAVVRVLEAGTRRVQRKDVKNQLSAFAKLSEGYLEWDLFRHQMAKSRLRDARDDGDHLRRLLPADGEDLLRKVRGHMDFLGLLEGGAPAGHQVLDLLANAGRCARRGRYDDAVARLYRAVEATGQLRLHEGHQMYQLDRQGRPIFSRLLLDKVPQPLRGVWEKRARDGFLALSLQDDYYLLEALNDPLAPRFAAMKGEESPLNARNQSILAHGFAPVGQKVCDSLWSDVLRLSGISEQELPEFPTLGSSPQEKEQSRQE